MSSNKETLKEPSFVTCDFCANSVPLDKWFSDWCECESCGKVICKRCRQDSSIARYKHDEDGGWYECVTCQTDLTTCQWCGETTPRQEIDPYLEKEFDKKICPNCLLEEGRKHLLETLKEKRNV